METGFRFEVTWNDNDVFKVRVTAWNGAFGGAADIYVPIGELGEAAAKLEDFPSKPSDVRELQFGAFGPEWAGGAACIRFWCKDGAGHAFIEAKIESDYAGADNAHSVRLAASVEATAVDTFVPELRRLESDRCGIAFLKASSPT